MNIQNLRTMPDVGCARGQAHSGTQWCAEAVEMGKELDALNAALDGVEKEIQNSACWIINGAFESGYAQAKQEAIDIIKKAREGKNEHD